MGFHGMIVGFHGTWGRFNASLAEELEKRLDRSTDMTHITSMLDAYPKDLGHIDRDKLAACIAACFECSQTCTACADACLSEDNVAEMAKCIRSNLDCADICASTGNVLSRQTGYDANITRSVLEACRTVCRSCADECGEHAGMHEHCKVCAEVCRRCGKACDELISSLG